MKKNNIYAVLLAGGKGTRLWPLSTGNYSKSFIRIGKRTPPILEVIKKLRGIIHKENIVIVVDKAQEKILRSVVKGIPRKNIIVEPFGRSTASAIGLASIELHPDDIMVVLPTDSVIKGLNGFSKAIKSAIDFVSRKDDVLACIGIKPKGATTAYGYIKIKSRQRKDVYSVDKFIEKPKASAALKFLKRKDYLWNGGMFIFKAKGILKAMKRHAPLLYRELSSIKKDKKKKAAAYSRMKNVSIDYQIMEKARNLYCVRGNFTWHDLGSFKSLEKLFKKDKNGNVCFGKTKLIDTHDSIVYNLKEGKLGVVGLKDMVVVQTKDGTLVCNKHDAEKVKELAK